MVEINSNVQRASAYHIVYAWINLLPVSASAFDKKFRKYRMIKYRAILMQSFTFKKFVILSNCYSLR